MYKPGVLAGQQVYFSKCMMASVMFPLIKTCSSIVFLQVNNLLTYVTHVFQPTFYNKVIFDHSLFLKQP